MICSLDKGKQIIISCLDKGEKGTNLALEFGISKQQISDICKNKDKILKFTDNIETSEGLKRKLLKLANDEWLDEALYSWFIQQRSTGTPISGQLLQEKAKHFSLQLHVNGESPNHESFKASTGWLKFTRTLQPGKFNMSKKLEIKIHLMLSTRKIGSIYTMSSRLRIKCQMNK